MEGNIKLAIAGYNQEKLILTRELSSLDGSDSSISRVGNAERRLKIIDSNIDKLLNN